MAPLYGLHFQMYRKRVSHTYKINQMRKKYSMCSKIYST